MLRNSISRIITMNVFGASQNGAKNRTISEIQSSNKAILSDIKLQRIEIVTMKSNIENLQLKIKSIENTIEVNRKSIYDSETRISELFNNYGEISTYMGITGIDVTRLETEINKLNTEIKHIAKFDESTLSAHGAYIVDLRTRLLKIEENHAKKN